MYYSESPARVDKTTRLLRQYICYNLSEKIHWLPHLLTKIEKKWLIFQLLCGVAQIHSTEICHGDIKPENVLVTSYDWLFIADILPYKPVLIKDDDLKAYNEQFGDLDNNNRCYTAPERWRSNFNKDEKLKPQMDIFSAGCVIAEIMMDGLPLFDLAGLQGHRRGTYDPKIDLQNRIKDQSIVQLILQMIDRDPEKRPDITKCLMDWNEQVFPSSFSQVLIHLGASFQRVSHLYSDNKISLLRYHFNSVYETSAGIFNISESLKEPIEPSIYNWLRSSDTVFLFNQMQPQLENFNFYHKSNTEQQMKSRLSERTQDDKDTLLLIALWLGKLFTSSFYPQSKLVALEMIQLISHDLPFQIRLNLVLPLVKEAFTTTGTDEVQKLCSSTSKIKTKALEVTLGLFHELTSNANIENIMIEPLDYKVVSSYIIPSIKRQMELSKTDQFMRLCIATNLGKLIRIAQRFIQISIISSTNKRKEALESRKEALVRKQNEEEKEPTEFFGQKFGAHRSTIVSRREDLQVTEVEILEEDTTIPNYETSLKEIWEEVDAFISHIFAGDDNNNIMMALLYSFIELSQIFGVEECNLLIQHCLSCQNKNKGYKGFKVRIQVLKTFAGMSNKIGIKKVDELVLPLAEELLWDPEDLVIQASLKIINFLVESKLVYKQRCLKLLDQLLPFALYPNQQIRMEVAKFVYLLTPKRQKELNGKQQIELDDFYCFVRPKLITFVKEYYQMEIMNYLDSPELILQNLRDPLSLKVMRAYFTLFTNMVDKAEIKLKEENFASKHCPVQLQNNDHFAFAALSSIFRSKLERINKIKQEDNKQIDVIQLQQKQSDNLYRVIRQSAVQKLASGVMVAHNQKPNHDSTEEQQVQIVQYYSQEEHLFTCQKEASSESNYGLNEKTDPALLVQGIPFEMSQILRGLNVVPTIPEAKTFRNIVKREKGDISRFLRVNSELQIATKGAQASLLDQFDYLQPAQKQTVKVIDEHRREFQSKKDKEKEIIRPQGTLITTLHEHNSAVNTITVTDDQTHFMTGSKQDMKIHIWKVQNIQKDNNSRSIHSIETKSVLNQLCMISNSNTLAAATEKGIELYDINRVTLQSESDLEKRADMKFLDFGEVLQIQSMQSPITYQNFIVAAKQTGGVLLYDMRSRQCAINDENVFIRQGGAVSAMSVGKDAFTLTVGTLGGYVATYDIRYSTVSALYMHHLNFPVLALATYRKNQLPGPGYNMSTLVSMGGPQHELCQLDVETGQVTTLYRVQNQPTGSSNITRAEIPNIPEFYRETRFKDRFFGTLKRDSNLNLFHRSLVNTGSNSFSQIINQEGIDKYYMQLSTERFKRINDAYKSQNTCRSILVPRDQFQSLMFDNETAGYAITGGHDRKIRYWNLQEPDVLSYQINSPFDDEVLYMKENVQKGVKLVVEKQLGQKDFPKYTTARIKDQISTLDTKCLIRNKQHLVKYSDNTSYNNAIATLVQAKVQNQNSSKPNAVDWSHIQFQDTGNGYISINSIGGLSQTQNLNNLAITPDPIEDSSEHRISDVVSHQDAILDMAICQDMLISCGRDGLIKIWK